MKELKFNQNKGFWNVLILGIMFVVVGIVLIVNFTTKTADSMYNSGDIYGRMTIKKNYAMTVAITKASNEVAMQDDKSYYVVETEDLKYIVLEVPEKFAKFNKENFSVFETPLKLAVEVGKWDAETQMKWHELAVSLGISQHFEKIYFLSTVRYENSKMWMMILGVGATILGGFIIFSAFKKRKKNGATYEDLLVIYPELKDNLTLVKTEGLFVSDLLKFYIYKNHLLSVKNGFDTLDLSEVSWIDFKTTTYRGSTTAQLPYLLNKETKPKEFMFGNYSKKHVKEMERLFETFEQHFVHIALGLENCPKRVSGKTSKKTIAEFVAEQQAKVNLDNNKELVQEEIVPDNIKEIEEIVNDAVVDMSQVEKNEDEV